MKLIRKPAEQERESTIFKNVFKLIPYWPMFVALFTVAIVAAWLYLKYTPSMYEVTAKILIKDDKRGSEDTKTVESLDIISPKRTIDNELEVIQSRDLISKVVSDLNLYAPIYETKSFKDQLLWSNSPLTISTNDLSSLTPAKKVFFKIKGNQVLIKNVGYPFNVLVGTAYGNLKFTKNTHYQADDDDDNPNFYFSLLAPKKVIAAAAAKLNVEAANKLSTIIDISYTDEDMDRGESIVNDIIKNYNLAIVAEKNVLAANTDKFISDRLSTVENKLLDIEHKQQNYQSNKGAIDIGTQGKLFLENVSNNDQKVSEINMQLSVLKQIDRYVRSKNLTNGIVPSTAGVDDPGLTEMVKNVYELQLEAESLKKTAGENNPLVLEDNQKIENIRPQIIENIENQKQSLLASKRNLSSTNMGYSSQLESMPETQKNLVDINRELNIESGIYTFLLQKKEETALSFISNDDGGKVVENAAASEFPVSPKGNIIYLASVFIAFLIGVGFVASRESLRRNIMYQTEIESLTQLPVISEITAGEGKLPIVIGGNQRTLIAEQFRRLRTTLNSLGIGGIKKRVLITSAISGEGKSFVALNLAISLAMTGKKVALLDFDLNNPSLHNKLNTKKGLGITDFLEGKVTADSIINQTEANENLSFVSAGNLSDTPSELIATSGPQDLLMYLDDIFDYVIIDIAPLGPVSDAYILSPLCDATLFIVRHAYTPKVFIERIDKNNALNKLNNAAIVFNDVSSRSFGDYGYGYGYGYVYGNEKSKKLT